MWKKNRENNSSKKSGGGVPSFNCFFKKSLVGLAMVGLTIASPIMLAGCSDGKDGANGADGTMWYTGTEQPEESQGKVGDFFYDTETSTIYIKTETGWESQGSIKGDKGDTGDTGNGIASITESKPTEDGTYTYTIKFTDTSVADYVFTVKNGAKGDTGNGISSITIDNDSTKTNDSQTTYIINFTDNTSYSFVVKNGTNGTNGNDGVSITGITKGPSNGNVDTYIITYSNNTSSTFTVTNGTDGKDGATWLTGEEDPTDTQGKNGDMYLNTKTYNVFKKANDTWGTAIANLKGATGAQGEQGEKGEKGDKGEQGTSWRFGTTVPASSLGNNGDLYVNTTNWYVYTKTNGTWSYQGCLKGEKGEKGTDGASTADALVYTGFDGYVWQGRNRTSIKAASTGTVDENIRENSLTITETMAIYYPGDYLDLTSNQIAIMSSYFPNIGKTQYSGTRISSITIYAKEAGDLYIGTASVADVIKAKKNSLSSITSTTTAYSVVAGKNEIILNLQIGDNETLVIGGNNSVGIYYAQGIPVSDTIGGYAYINGEYNENIIEMTGDYNDTLAIEILVGAWSSSSEVALYSDIKDALIGQKSGFNITLTPSEKYGVVITACGDGETPAPAYQGETITKIGFILSDYLTTEEKGRTKVTDDDAIMYAYKVKSSLIEGSGSIADNYIEKYLLTFKNYKKNTSTSNLGPLVTIGSDPWSYTTSMKLYDSTTQEYTAVNGIEIGSDELIAFVVGNCDIILVTNTSAATDVYNNAYTYQGTKGYYHYYDCTEDKVTWYWKACNPSALPVDIYYKGDGATVSFEENYAKLEAEEAEAIEMNKAKQVQDAYTNGKTISFLGDSLTAYAGWSDNSSYNTTLDGYDTSGDDTNDVSANYNSYGVTYNGSVFGGITSANQTWWKQSADDMGMTVLVNNSSSGSQVSGTPISDGGTEKDGVNRCEQLHNDTGDTDVNPDIIAVYMGINDLLNDSITADSFKTSYTTMIEKIVAKYRNTENGTNAEIVVFTLPYIKLMDGTTTNFVDIDRLTAFNNAIKDVGIANGCTVVEVYPDYSWTADNWTENCITDVNSGLGHPNAEGMDLITNAFIDTMYNKYVTKTYSVSPSSSSSDASSDDASSAENTESTTTNTNE